MVMMKVEVISRETIKPSSPTPHHLRTFNLSFLDQIAPPVYVPIMLFYTNDSHGSTIESLERCRRLKKSLPETLTRFYPVSGRIKEDVLIDCNDMGVDYFEAKVNGLLSDVIKQPNTDLLQQFLPCQSYCPGSGSGSDVPIAIQVNVFDCGGMALCVCISHKIADACSLTAFVNGWGTTAHQASDPVHPNFELPSLFPQRNLSGFMATTGIQSEKIVTKRFVFDASIIASLRSKASNNKSCVDNPTRIEAVSTFLWKRYMDVAHAKDGPVRIHAALHAVNLRRRMVPPLSEYYFGNMYTTAIAPLPMEIEKQYCHDLVGLLRDSIRRIDGEYVRKLQEGDAHLNSIMADAERVSKGEIDLLHFSSWCKFPLYETDFGWGKPIWVSTTTLPFKNVVILMDTRSGDGIEAWVNMVEEVMVEFERSLNLDLLSFVSLKQNNSFGPC